MSSISEWIVATLFSFYILSFADEFKYIEFDHPEISFIIIEQDIETNVLIEQEDNEQQDVEQSTESA